MLFSGNLFAPERREEEASAFQIKSLFGLAMLLVLFIRRSCTGVLDIIVLRNFSHMLLFDACIECFMSWAAMSAAMVGKHEGDVRIDIFEINTDTNGKMFTDDGEFVVGDSVTLDFSSLNCHENKDVKWARCL